MWSIVTIKVSNQFKNILIRFSILEIDKLSKKLAKIN